MHDDSLLLPIFHERHGRKGIFNNKMKKLNDKAKLQVVLKMFKKMKKRYKNVEVNKVSEWEQVNVELKFIT